MITDETAKVPTTETVEQVLGRLASTARADTIFGEPVERGDITVIPCSEVAVGLGMGSGSGPVDAQGNKAGGGSGGGGGASGRPIAVIVISKDRVRVEPVLDLTKVVLAAFSTGAFLLFWVARLSRMGRSLKGPSFSQFRRAIQK
jgi:uncharacterized spore protein YtfJ